MISGEESQERVIFVTKKYLVEKRVNQWGIYESFILFFKNMHFSCLDKCSSFINFTRNVKKTT